MSDVLVVTAEIRNLDKMLADLAKLGGPDVGSLLRRRVGLLARVCSEHTQPVADKETGEQVTEATVKIAANGAAARKLGENAIKRDLRRIFDVVKGGFIAAPAKGHTDKLVLYKGGGRRGGQRQAYLIDRRYYATGGASMYQFHQSRRQPSTGRASTAGLRDQRNGRWKSGDTMAAPESAFNAYQKNALRRVGFSKAGWITAGRSIPGAEGLSKVPAWIGRHSAPGTAQDHTRGDNPHVVLINRVPWASRVMRQANIVRINRAFGRLLRKDILAQIDHLKSKHHA